MVADNGYCVAFVALGDGFMGSALKIFVLGLLLMGAGLSNAQLLLNNHTLNAQSVQRWMESNRDMVPVMQVLDQMHTSAEAMAAFDALSAALQDEQIDAFLRTQQLLDNAQAMVQRHGWKSVGEYQRLGTRLGNAIAAYFLAQDIQGLTEEQLQVLRDNTDPALLAVPEADIAFVKANEKALQQYIQAYAAGR